MSDNDNATSAPPKRTRRAPYSKLVDEIWAAAIAQRKRKGDQPKPPPLTEMLKHTELDQYGLPIDGSDNSSTPRDRSILSWRDMGR